MTYKRDILTFSEFFNCYILDDPHKPLNSYQKRLLDTIYEGPPKQERPKFYICMGRQNGRDAIWKWLEQESMIDQINRLIRISHSEEDINDDQLRRCNPAKSL